MITMAEKEILRELARQYAALAALDIQAERRTRAKHINDRIPERPIVWINEIPWHEMDIDGQLKITCADPFARSMEWFFRMTLFRWRYFQADMIVENYYPIPRTMHSDGIGLGISEKRLATDDRNHIVSHNYQDQLDTEEKLEALRLPTITADPVADAQNAALASEILDGILPVRLQGHLFYHAPWDTISMLRGVTPVMIDLAERPAFMHKTIQKFTEAGMATLRQMESLGLLDNQITDLHCTPAYVSDLFDRPAASADGGVKSGDVWFRGMAQMFSDVSPAMHQEFELDYIKPLCAACGVVYYGCCEALHKKIDILKKMPNMRKIGVSPWADVRVSAEQIGGQFVYAHKPNPAFVSGHFDRETVEREIAGVIEACQANGCPYEFVLKDISTVSYRPANLIAWHDTVQATINRYYT